MRIISGTHKGRRIIAPKKLPVRPTTDRAKEALFNILTNRFVFPEISVLDLFSGTGNIAYEFASRGTPQITAVDVHYECVKFIKEMAKNLEMPITAVKTDTYNYLKKTPHSFDLIFADPPYDLSTENFLDIPKHIFQRNLLKEDGLLIVEHSKHTDLTTAPFLVENRKYGAAVFSFFQQKEQE